MSRNVFVLGLDPHNRDILERLPGADELTFHRLLRRDELQSGEIDVLADLDRVVEQLEDFDGAIDAVVSFWDFPMVLMVPILCERYGLPSADLTAVLKCEHKFWARRVQSEVIGEVPAYGVLDPDDPDPVLPAGMRYPVWIKPVVGTASQGAFLVADEDDLRRFLPRTRRTVTRLGRPFQDVLDRVDLPPEIAAVGGEACLVEEAVTGRQMTVEGFSHGGEISLYGVVDSVTVPGGSSFLRYQYPSQVAASVQERMADVSRRVIAHTGLTNSAFNIEFFWDEASGRLSLLEINARHSQSHADLFELVDGLSNHQVMLDLAFGRQPRMPEDRGRCAVAAKWFVRTFRDGFVRRAPTADEVAALERELPDTTIEIAVTEGARLSDGYGEDSYSYVLATVFTGGADEAELERTYARCLDALPFEIDELADTRGGA